MARDSAPSYNGCWTVVADCDFQAELQRWYAEQNCLLAIMLLYSFEPLDQRCTGSYDLSMETSDTDWPVLVKKEEATCVSIGCNIYTSANRPIFPKYSTYKQCQFHHPRYSSYVVYGTHWGCIIRTLECVSTSRLLSGPTILSEINVGEIPSYKHVYTVIFVKYFLFQ
jgi:hypothetical protein